MTDLSDKMRALCPAHPKRAAELRENANAFDAATTGYYGDPQTVSALKFLGVYARARKLYCEITGEPLV